MLKTKNSQSAATNSLSGNPISWATSHLRTLTVKEYEALIDLPRAWFEGRSWNVSRDCDMELIYEFAERHGCGGLLGSPVIRADEKLKAGRFQSRYFANLLYSEKCKRICRRLQNAARRLNIPIAVIKGPALVLQGYHDPGIRTYSDIDILIGSRQEAWRLITDLCCQCREPRIDHNKWRRLNHPGRIHADLDGWELEFCYPTFWSGDLMFDLIKRYPEKILKIPENDDELAVPDPNLHMVILLQHMARHLCSRLIWFLDIAVFQRYHHKALNWRWIENELDLLQLRNMGAFISMFCREHIDPEFPKLEFNQAGWNTKIQSIMVSSRQIYGRISLFHASGWRKPFSFVLSAARFFLITDPCYHRLYRDSVAVESLTARLMNVFERDEKALASVLKRILFIALFPFSWCIGNILFFTQPRQHLPCDAAKR